jgi:hypothetical protein
MEDEDLSDEQFHQLLKDAEQRLRNAQGRQQTQSRSISSLPKRYFDHSLRKFFWQQLTDL